jgi:hypothetical protein
MQIYNYFYKNKPSTKLIIEGVKTKTLMKKALTNIINLTGLNTFVNI